LQLSYFIKIIEDITCDSTNYDFFFNILFIICYFEKKRKTPFVEYNVFIYKMCLCVSMMVGEWHWLRKGKRGRSACGRVDELLVVIRQPSHQHRGPQKKKDYWRSKRDIDHDSEKQLCQSLSSVCLERRRLIQLSKAIKPIQKCCLHQPLCVLPRHPR